MTRSRHMLRFDSLLLLLLHLPLITDASPTGAGSCTVGAAAVGGAHTAAARQIITGPASSEKGYQFTLDDQILTPKTPFNVTIISSQQNEVIHNITLKALVPSSNFKGFSIVATTSLRVWDASTQKPNNLCRGAENNNNNNNNNAQGITHTSAAVKEAVSVGLVLPSTTDKIPLDITVVVQNQNGISEYYYSQYIIHAETIMSVPSTTRDDVETPPVTTNDIETPPVTANDDVETPPTTTSDNNEGNTAGASLTRPPSDTVITEGNTAGASLTRPPATTDNNDDDDDDDTNTILALLPQSPDLLTASWLLINQTASQLLSFVQGDFASWTLLAPTDTAFEQTNPRVKRILSDPVFADHLVDLLSYHAAPNTVTTQMIYQALQASTDNSALDQQLIMSNQEFINVSLGTSASLNEEAQTIVLNGGMATVIREDDINATDGIVHVIDQLLLPASARLDIVAALTLVDEEDTNTDNNLPGRFSTLLSLIDSAGLVEALQVPGPFTMFAPTNEAFANMNAGEFEYLSQPSQEGILVDILQYHVTTVVSSWSNWQNGTELTMLNFKNTTVLLDGTPRIASSSSVTAQFLDTDNKAILANNGIIHAIDTVLIPAAVLITPPLETVALGDIANVSQFRSGLESVNIDKLLSSSTVNYTIFAPLDDILLADEDYQFFSANPDPWSGHLTKYLEHHIIAGHQYTTGELFSDTATTSSTSLTGDPIAINADSQLIGGHTILESYQIASNGILHTISGVLFDATSSMSLAELVVNGIDDTVPTIGRKLQTSGDFSVLTGLLTEASLITNEGSLTQRYQSGTTLVAPTDAALGGQLVEGGSVNDFLLYHVLGSNIYQENLGNASQRLLPTLHPTAQVWLTVDENGIMRYNDVVVEKETLGSNGILDVVTDTSLSAPDMVALLKHTDTFTNLDVNIMQGFLNASTWNASTMSFSKNDTMKDLVGGSRVTLIVPLDEYLNSALNALAIRRLRSPVWSRHLHDMLGHMMLPRIYTQEEIRTEAGVAGGFGQTETVAGTFISTETSSGTSIGGGVLQDPSMNAIDGLIHLVDRFNLPPSVATSLDELIASSQTTTDFSMLLTGDAGLLSLVGTRSPITVFIPADGSWDESIPSEQVSNILQNHIFDRFWFSDNLLEMNGENITSINDKTWKVIVQGGSVRLAAVDESTSVEVQPPFDILGRNGVLHTLDGILLGGPAVIPANCTACTGERLPNILSDGRTCEEWHTTASQVLEGGQDCILEQIAGVSYCGCDTPENAGFCGAFCPEGMDVSARTREFVPDRDFGLTCAEVNAAVNFISNVTFCPEIESMSNKCCDPTAAPVTLAPSIAIPGSFPSPRPPTTGVSRPTRTPTPIITPVPTIKATFLPSTAPMQLTIPTVPGALVRVNATFIIYNTENLTAKDVRLPENSVIFQRSFEDFVKTVIYEVKAQQRFLRSDQSSWRRLEVFLQAESAEVYGARNVRCPSRMPDGNTVPQGANCQDILGRYDVSVIDEDPAPVQKKYSEATEKALNEGKMQESLNKTDPNSAFSVGGTARTMDEAADNTINKAPSDKSSGGMEVWLIVLIVLLVVLGLCLVTAAVAYYFLRQKKSLEKKDYEMSVKLVDDEDGDDTPSESPPTVPNPTIPDKGGRDESASTGSDNDDGESIKKEAVRGSERGSTVVIVPDHVNEDTQENNNTREDEGGDTNNVDNADNPVWEDENDDDDSFPGPVSESDSGESFDSDPDRNENTPDIAAYADPSIRAAHKDPLHANEPVWQDEG